MTEEHNKNIERISNESLSLQKLLYIQQTENQEIKDQIKKLKKQNGESESNEPEISTQNHNLHFQQLNEFQTKIMKLENDACALKKRK